jgi:glutamate transport system substrate-binding protein
MKSRHRASRVLAAVAAVGIVTALVAGCAPTSPGSTKASATSGPDTIDKIMAEAPVAATADMPTGSTMAKIHDAGALNVGGVESAALFSLKDTTTGKVTGFDAYLSQMLAKYIVGKPETKLTTVTSQTREQVLENGTVNVVFATYTITAKRAERVAFAGPYFASPLAIGVAVDNADIKSVTDLGGKDVCVQANSTAVAALTKAAPTARQTALNTNNECLEALKQKRVQAYVVDQALLIAAEAKSHDIKVLAFGASDVADPYGIGLPKDQADMKTFVNTWLQTIIDKGLWARVWKLTIGKVVPGEPPAPPKIGSVPGS